jgi:uroporphyrinogen-III synthase
LEVEAYRSVLPEAPQAPFVADELRRGRIDLLTFTSSSTVHHFVQLMRDQQEVPIEGKLAACIGPVTANTARSYGMRVVVEPKEYTVDALLEGIVELFRGQGGNL